MAMLPCTENNSYKNISCNHLRNKKEEKEEGRGGKAIKNMPFLGAFAKLRKATISFLVSVRMELGSHSTDFHEI